MNPFPTRQPQAFVLVAVLLVTMLTSMIAVSLIYRLRAEELAAAAGTASDLARATALSGIQHAIHLAANAAPGSLDWKSQPAQLHHQLVFDDGAEQWFFTVYTRDEEQTDPVRYGLEDEASKLNILETDEVSLSSLPALDTPKVHALLDFLDPDDSPSPEGAEQEYYNNLAFPYTIRNGPMASLEELLLVRGFSPALVYGEDLNFNHRLDANEDDGDLQFPPDDSSGDLQPGLRDIFTISSYDPNQTDEGFARINLNDPAESYSESDFPEPLVAFITALRNNKQTLPHPAQLLQASLTVKDDQGKDVTIESGVGAEQLPLVLDAFTTSDKDRIPGLININTAPASVLQTIPGLEPNLAEIIVAARRGLDPSRRRSIAWLLQENVVDMEIFKRLAPYLTARSFQFRFQVIGYSLPSGRYQILEVGIDLAARPPVVSYLRDLTRLGLPFDIRTENSNFDG